MKSIVNSDEAKKKILEAVSKALDECAFQHVASVLGSNFHNAEQPNKLKLTFNFYWDDEQYPKKSGDLFCQPIIDLTDLSTKD